MMESEERRLEWEQVRHDCQPIGKQGYWADCFLLKNQGLVLKKFRDKAHESIVQTQIANCRFVEKAWGQLIMHIVYQDGVVQGFTTPFRRGRQWESLIADPDSLFRRSPLARLRLVRALLERIRELQRINFCHGDLHLENVLINCLGSCEDPKVEAWVIDLGNGFEMKEGQRVSQGLTGWDCLVPPEAQFAGKKNYDPRGVNAYQLGRVVLLVLLLRTHQQMQSLNYLPMAELDELKATEVFPEEVVNWVSELLHYDLDRRVQALFSNVNHLGET